jgi:hypothetical protein
VTAGVSVEVLGKTASGRYRIRVTRSSQSASGVSFGSSTTTRAAQITEETARLPSELVVWPYSLSGASSPD